MADLLSLSEAAKLLNITEDELRTLAQESKINGVRSDDDFSFKEAELQRYADEQGITLGDDASVLVDEGGEGSVFTGEGAAGDSDLKLADEIDDDLELMDGADQSMELDLSGELDLLDDESEDDGEQDPNENTQFSLGDGNLDLDDLSLDLADDDEDLDPNEKTVFGGELDLDADELSLELDDVDQNEKTVFGGALPEGDALDLVPDDELAIDLGGGADENEDTQFAFGADGFQIDDDELVIGDDAELAGGAGSSDIALAGDSGINLGSPADSGISLEDGAVNLVGGSSPSLELPEDISDIQQDDEFMLAPSDELSEESDSGSQIIALSDSVQFGDPAAVGGDAPADPFAGAAPAAPFEGGAPADPFAPASMGPAIGGLDPNMGGVQAAAPMAMGGPDPFGSMGPEVGELEAPMPVVGPADTAADPPYTYFNVIGLLVIIIIQALVAVMMVELISNIWGIYRDTWEPGTETSIGKPILDMFKDLVNNENWISILGGVMGGFFLVLIIGWIVDGNRAKKQSASELPPTLG